MHFFLAFEKPLVELEQKIRELRQYSTENVDFSSEIKKLEKKSEKLREEIFSNLSRWQRTQLARHVNRPFTSTTSSTSLPTGLRFMATATSATTRRWSAASPVSTASRAASSATRRGATPRRRSTATSACPTPKAIARRCG